VVWPEVDDDYNRLVKVRRAKLPAKVPSSGDKEQKAKRSKYYKADKAIWKDKVKRNAGEGREMGRRVIRQVDVLMTRTKLLACVEVVRKRV